MENSLYPVVQVLTVRHQEHCGYYAAKWSSAIYRNFAHCHGLGGKVIGHIVARVASKTIKGVGPQLWIVRITIARTI